MVTIRRAISQDAETLWRAEVETARTPGLLVSRPEELSLESVHRTIRELEAPGSFVVASLADEILGHAFLDPMSLESLRHVWRLTIVVHPGSTGQGVGTALLDHLLHWAAAESDVGKIELLVRATNHGAIRLYERMGFVEEGRLRSRVRLPDGSFVDDVAMAWFPASYPRKRG